jgi:manganese-dependent inorganic pyrophosphatase
MAGMLAAAIISDTVMFKSPTCTQRDIAMANRMARIGNVRLEDLGKAIFSATCGDEKTTLAMLNTDYKEFHIAGHDLAVSQITCMDSDRLLLRKDEFLYEMERIRLKQGLDSVVLMLTDVLLEGTYLIFVGDEENIRNAFGIKETDENISFQPKLMSRKKQVIPTLSALWG